MSAVVMAPAVRRPLVSPFTPGLRPTTVLLTLAITKRTLSSWVLPSTRPQSPRTPSHRPSILAATPPPISTTTPSSFFTPSLCRHASTSATTSPAPSSPTAKASTSKASPASTGLLDWNTFFTLRTSRRRYSIASSILASASSFAGVISILTVRPELQDEVTAVIPTDPVVGLGLVTFGAALLGWLLGPIFGNGMWRLLHRARLPEFTMKERAFFERIKKHRVNPEGASTSNPVPDYYGEKIGSVGGYRRWLKDQRAFNRKKGSNFLA